MRQHVTVHAIVNATAVSSLLMILGIIKDMGMECGLQLLTAILVQSKFLMRASKQKSCYRCSIFCWCLVTLIIDKVYDTVAIFLLQNKI